MATNRQDPTPKTRKTGGQGETPAPETPDRPHETAKERAVAASNIEAAPADQTSVTGNSFYNPSLTGSGTIMADGTYGAPLPDPNVDKLKDGESAK